MKVKMILPALTEAVSPYWRPIKYSLFPPLGLATLAGYLNDDDEITIQDEHVETLDLSDEPDLVVITKRPFGSPFVAWGSTAWEAANPGGAAYYWQATLPPDLSAEKLAVIGCLLCTYKPAHSVVVDEAGERFCEGV